MSSSLVSSSLRSASLNMATQVAFRVVTFAMNAWVLRHISREVLGLVNVRLNLLDDTIMFLSKEGFRLACLGHKGREGWQQMVNLMWLTVPVSLLWSLLFGWVWLSLLPGPGPGLQSQYTTAVLLVAASGPLQMLAEPAWLAGQLLEFVRLRAALDTVWVLTRAAVLCLAVAHWPDQVLVVWAGGHALAGLLYVLGHYAAFYVIIRVNRSQARCGHFPLSSLADLLPSVAQFSVNPEQWQVARGFLGQGLVKQLLTEGERYVMTVFSLLTLPEQGIFDVVSNLGSLAARFVFRPVEEAAYFFFSQLWERGAGLAGQGAEQRDKVELGLYRLLRLSLLLGLTVLSLGFSYSHLLLHLYGGLTLTDGPGPALLRAQCGLVLALAVNGITECFARAVMTEAEIHRYTRIMSAMSAVYLALAFGLTKLFGPIGFVLANICNMLVRIGFAVRLIRQTWAGSEKESSPLAGLAPDSDLLLLLLSAGVTCQLSEQYLYQHFAPLHLLIGVTCGVIILVAIVVKEDFILAFIVEKYRAVCFRQQTEEEGEEEDNASGKEKSE